MTRGRWRCDECAARFSYSSILEVHGIEHNHLAFACPRKSCSYGTKDYGAQLRHMREAHNKLRTCHECSEDSRNVTDLGLHASRTGHAPFACKEGGCQSTFSRHDVYVRHLDIHNKNMPPYPCRFCNRHRGRHGFKRRDRLTQHLRNYHHFNEEEAPGVGKSCPHRDCPVYRELSEEHTFKKSSEYTAHMRKAHDESPFPCPKPGCNRVGGKGYFRELDLMKHQKREHRHAE